MTRASNTLDLYTQVKQAHWNVCGPQFYQLHLLFDTLAEEVEPFIDVVAERVVMLGGVALGTARNVSDRSSLPDYPFEITTGEAHVKTVVERYAVYLASTKAVLKQSEDLCDAVTTDMLTEISRTVEKHHWFLEAHLR